MKGSICRYLGIFGEEEGVVSAEFRNAEKESEQNIRYLIAHLLQSYM